MVASLLASAKLLDMTDISYIRDVWHDNLEAELASIREMIVSYPFISMVRAALLSLSTIPANTELHPVLVQDTEFPGVVAKPVGSFRSSSDYHFQTLRCNVDLLKIIQVRIVSCWYRSLHQRWCVAAGADLL